MQKILTTKIAIIGLIAVILMIPLSMISGKISERSVYLQEAKNSVASSWTGPQKIVGPIIVLPYVVETKEEVWSAEKKETTIQVRKTSKKQFFFPEQLKFETSISNDMRYKGIYKVPVYTAQLNVKGMVNLESIQRAIKNIKKKGDAVTIGKAYLSTMVSDPRGINSFPRLNWSNKTLAFSPGSKLHANTNGIHAYLPDLAPPNLIQANLSDIKFSFKLELRGMETISFVPVGQEANVKVLSSWPHPEFTGMFLPTSRAIDEEGYQAEWNITSFASNITDKVKSCERGSCNELFVNSFGVKHIETVDVYLQSERSVKYGLLFIGLSFIAFFVFEIVKKLPIHAIQYTLVGVAIATFYLLLVSLSEHIPFAYAYLIATLCCVSLLFFYLCFVLRGFKQALGFSSLLSLLYGVLYVIISAEDFALLMGASLTFLALLVVMISTRNIDWYEVSERISSVKPGRKDVPNVDTEHELER